MPVEQKIEELYQQVVQMPGGGRLGGVRPYDDVLRSRGVWSSSRDRVGPYRRLQEAGGLVGNATQREMLYGGGRR